MGNLHHRNGVNAANWDSQVGDAWHDNRIKATSWNNDVGKAWYDESGDYKGRGTEIYLGDNIRIYAGPRGVRIYVNGECVNF